LSHSLKAIFSLCLSSLVIVLLASCDSAISEEPRDLLLAPDDMPGAGVSVVSLTEEQSLDGPSAQVKLQGVGFQVVQSLVLFENREVALSALDGIRADLVSRGETGPGQPEASGVFEHKLGNEDAASLFFIENNGLVRLTVTGPDRRARLSELADVARDNLNGS
jgi:hypothetical protein